MHLPSVAPRDLIQADYDVLKSYEHLDTTSEIEELLLIQSLEGRAHNGAGVFHKRTYVNTTIDDVVRALGRDPDKIKNRRQKLIDDIADFATAVMDGERRERLLNGDGEAILGISYFHERKVNGRDVLRGLYLGGLRDNPDIRKEAERIYQAQIGGGRCYIVDIATMLKINHNGETLAHEAHEEELDSFMKSGLIVGTEGAVNADTQRYFYIRHRLGPGQSDDAAFVLTGILYNSDVALGVFLADAIDTLEKYAPLYRDQDGALAFQIGRGFKDLGLSMEDVYELVWLAAIPETEEHLVPDSSLRYLLSIDQRTQHTAFRSHLDFMEGRPILPIPVSFKQILSTQFYDYINRRLVNVKKLEKLAMPRLRVEEMERDVMEIARKDFGVISKDATFADVIRKFRETKSEILIVQDKNQKVVGIVNPTDLLYYLKERP